MDNLKTLFAVLLLFVGITIGMSYKFMYSGAPTRFVNKIPQALKPSVFENSSPGQLAASTNLLTADSGGVAANKIKPAKQSSHKIQKLPGVFRGDWGETPIYTAYDRVTYEGAAYLSLADYNQNQPPPLSPGFWRMVKEANVRNEGACLLAGPGAKLDECDFTERNSLKDMDLQGANLSKTRLNGELGSANLRHANLSGATVIGSLVISPDTRIDHADLSGLHSDGNNPVIAEAANMSEVNFANANLYGAKMKDANLASAKLTGATLTGADMRSSHLEGADLSKTDLTYAKLAAGSLTGANLRQADLTEANLSKADFSGANFHEANLAGSDLAGTNLSGADLRGANLADAQSSDTAFIDSETNFTSATCPDGVVVDGTWITSCVGHGF